MVINSYSITIDGINYTRRAIFPIKFANLLDESLDECYLSLRHMRRKEFKPMTPVKIVFHNTVVFGSYTDYSHDETVHYFIANDDAKESPAGSGLWNHDLYLIEVTKYLEMIVVDSLTWRNSLGKNYTRNASIVFGTVTYDSWYHPLFDMMETLPNVFTPIATMTLVTLPSVKRVCNNYAGNANATNTCYIEVYKDNNLIAKLSGFKIAGIPDEYDQELTVNFKQSGSYVIIYRFQMSLISGAGEDYQAGTASYYLTVVSNQYPLKRITCTDVIKRLCDLAEPLLLGESSRFTLNEEQAELFNKIYAPEFSMTKQTLRECLKEVGQVVHGEPRLVVKDDGTYEIRYDMFGGTKHSYIGRHINIYRSSQAKIDSHCTSIDSSAQNLINQTDWAAGVITEPSGSDYRTVRTETQYVRITDSNMLIATDRPIYQVQSLRVLLPGVQPKAVDITPYVVESTIYNSQLSSYTAAYPYSKAYGIYYTQGEKNIQGLNFKQEDPIAPEFENYAIVNIIKQAAKAQGIDVNISEEGYPNLAFQITYIPFFDVRVAQSKSYYKEYNKVIALIYNQTANTIESRAYGENMKGAVARLGNPEISVTYIMSRWWQIPKAGELYDDEHYISAVSVEFLPNEIKCTVGLSKDFNRLNEYIGVSSEKRYYEVSERQTYDRSVLYHEYIVIGDQELSDSNLIGQNFMNAVADTFTQTGSYVPMTCVIAWGGTYADPTVTEAGESPLPCVQLPVVSTAFGNSMAFLWNYQDNYSAGSVSQYAENGEVKGYFQNDIQYTDYYGRMYYYNFDVQAPSSEISGSYAAMIERGRSLPLADMPGTRSGYLSTDRPYILRKDSAEIPQFNVQVEFITNRKELIIGSALASSCGLIRGSDANLKAELYVLDTPINKFTTRLSAMQSVPVKKGAEVSLVVTSDSVGFHISSAAFTAANLTKDGAAFVGKSWAIVTKETTKTYTVEDETGEVDEQDVIQGGEVLLAQNGTFHAGDSIGDIYFTPRRNLYGKLIYVLTEQNAGGTDKGGTSVVYRSYSFDEQTGVITLAEPCPLLSLSVGDICYWEGDDPTTIHKGQILEFMDYMDCRLKYSVIKSERRYINT